MTTFPFTLYTASTGGSYDTSPATKRFTVAVEGSGRGGGYVSWTDPGNAGGGTYTDYAYTGLGDDISKYLEFTDAGFNLPPTADNMNIDLNIRSYYVDSSKGNTTVDETWQLFNPNASWLESSNIANYTHTMPVGSVGDWDVAPYAGGDPNEVVWDIDPTADDINDPDFGFRLAVSSTWTGLMEPRVYYVDITITFDS